MFKRQKGVLVVVMVAGVGFLGPAIAQGPVATACGQEIASLCADKEHGRGEVRACLEANKDKVSAGCKQALDTTGPGKGMGMRKGPAK